MDNLTITNEEAEKYTIKIPEIPQSINLSQSNVNEIEVVLGDYEFILKDGKTYFVKKKPQYPTSYAECTEVMGWAPAHIEGYNGKLIKCLQKLLICRDTYWKIAGEQMGLNKPWEPDWSSDLLKYYISFYNDEVDKCVIQYSNKILVFPTEEMRDTFYENFKELIEICKELL